MPVMSQHRHLGSVQRPLRHFLNQIQIKARDETNKNRKGRTTEQDSEKKQKKTCCSRRPVLPLVAAMTSFFHKPFFLQIFRIVDRIIIIIKFVKINERYW